MGSSMENRVWVCRGRRIELGRRPLVMGVVNVTPDSFSDGGCWMDPDKAIAHGLQLVRDGADLLDIGGESTRPGAMPVPPDEEARRILPVIKALADCAGVPISVDSRRAEVARLAVEAGACIVNDVAPFAGDDEMANVVSETQVGLVAMHARGTPKEMASLTQYQSVVDEVEGVLRDAICFAQARGIDSSSVVIDPGIGFAKTTEQNLQLLAATDRLSGLAPVLIGVSRKRMIGEICHEPDAASRDGGSVGTAVWCALHGAAVLRVHAVRETRQALEMVMALEQKKEALECLKDSRSD